MKIFLLPFYFILIGFGCFNANAGKFVQDGKQRGVDENIAIINNSSVIDVFDTVVFDLSQSVIAGNYVSFPVSILSDDTINALDFSLKYNQSKLLFDSIYDLTNYMQSLSYYNTSDSTVRFTSSSFQRYSNDTSLVLVSFVLLSGQIFNTDLNSVVAYLNGNVCSIKVINSLPVGIREINENNNSVNVYPNPVSEILNVKVSMNSTIQLVDLNGKEVYFENIAAILNYEINIQNLIPGIYFLNVFNRENRLSKKVIIF